MKGISSKLPFWARALLLAGIVGIVLGAGLVAWRISAGPTTLSLAVGSVSYTHLTLPTILRV